jgi:hypothetical protein
MALARAPVNRLGPDLAAQPRASTPPDENAAEQAAYLDERPAEDRSNEPAADTPMDALARLGAVRS